jgi:hypothetical protein
VERARDEDPGRLAPLHRSQGEQRVLVGAARLAHEAHVAPREDGTVPEARFVALAAEVARERVTEGAREDDGGARVALRERCGSRDALASRVQRQLPARGRDPPVDGAAEHDDAADAPRQGHPRDLRLERPGDPLVDRQQHHGRDREEEERQERGREGMEAQPRGDEGERDHDDEQAARLQHGPQQFGHSVLPCRRVPAPQSTGAPAHGHIPLARTTGAPPPP